MSRKGNKLLTIPQGVTLAFELNKVIVTGPLGSLEVAYPANII